MNLIIIISSILVSIMVIGFSLRWNWWRKRKGGIPVLMYHKIGHAPALSAQKELWIDPQTFAWHMEYLKSKGFESVTFKDISQGIMPEKPVIITFDDGYLNCYENAFPIMQHFNMRGVFYIVFNAIAKDNFWHDPKNEPRIPMMNLEQIITMQKAGMEIGSHTLDHKRLKTLLLDDAKYELNESKKQLEALINEEMTSFAFPYGNGEDSPDLINAAFDAGYKYVIGIHSGIWQMDSGQNTEDSEAVPEYARQDSTPGQAKDPTDSVVPRIFVRGDDIRFDFMLQLKTGRSRQ
ncbi:polysaccharide deacetylase family protein [Elusimicrobiota bacterium]